MRISSSHQSSVLSGAMSWLARTWRHLNAKMNAPVSRYVLEERMIPPKLSGVSLRQYRTEDLEACLELCRVNAPNRFPEETLDEFKKYLSEEDIHYLVMEYQGRIVASGGYAFHHLDYIFFAYGLIHPDFQNQGLGKVLFFARVAQLPLIKNDSVIGIAAVAKSLPYYEKLGFQLHSEHWLDAQGDKHPLAFISVNAYLIYRSVLYLKRCDIPFPNLHPEPPKDLASRPSGDSKKMAEC